MTRLAGWDIGAPPLLMVPLLLAAVILVAIGIGRLMARLTRRWFLIAALGDVEARASEIPRVGVPISVAVFVAGLLLLAPDMALRAPEARWFRVVVTVLLVISCATALTRVAVAGVSTYARRRPTMAPATNVARMAVRIAIVILAVLMGLQSLGVPVTPLLTTLGIGSLAVALALQDTLANFFAGLYLLADRPVRPGDYIKLSIDGGAEGYVDSIGWRSSRLRTLIGNTVIVPNQKLSQTILTNFHLPLPELILSVPLRVPFEADADAVEKFLTDELSQIARALPDLLLGTPAARLTNLDDSGMLFQCIVQVRDFEAQGIAGHEIRKRIVARLKGEGISLGIPQRFVQEPPAANRRDFPGIG